MVESHLPMVAMQPDVGPPTTDRDVLGIHHPGAESTHHVKSSFIWKSRRLEDTRMDWRAVLFYPGRHETDIHRDMPCSEQA